MFDHILERLKENFINMVTSRLLILVLILFGMGGYLIYTLFQLQIVNGEEYFNNFHSPAELHFELRLFPLNFKKYSAFPSI